MDNKSAFQSDFYDANIRKVIPLYDEIYEQIIDLIKAYFEDKKISLLDTGCGSGMMGVKASEELYLKELVLCDPSLNMLEGARRKLEGKEICYLNIGSENLEFENRFDVVTAIQSHHYFDRETRKKAVDNCFRALKPGGMFICFENTAPFSDKGIDIMKRRVENFGIRNGRTKEEAKSHSERYNTEYFPLTIKEHLELLDSAGFSVCELFWNSYMQSGFYALKNF